MSTTDFRSPDDVLAQVHALVRTKRRRRRLRWTGTAALGVTVALLGAALSWPGERPGRIDVAQRPARRGSAAALATYHWSDLPPAPIAEPRSQLASAWTGRELLVWGGASGEREETLHDDGAAYDPATNTWRKLPTSPLGARQGMSSVWTGTEWIIWGGSSSDSTTLDTGAAYDPVTDTWRVLEASPLPAMGGPVAVWTGKEMVVFDGYLGGLVAGGDRTQVSAASYDATARVWRAMAPVPRVEGHVPNGVVAAWAGDRLLVWVQWSAFGQSGGPRYGEDLFTLAPDGAWQAVDPQPAPIGGVQQAIWTGAEVLVPAAPALRPGFGGGPASNLRGSVSETSGASWRPIAHGPVDDVAQAGLTVWAGSALLRIAGGSTAGVQPGDIAAWDPDRDTWTRLPTMPLTPDYRAVAVWTGREVLVWGGLYEPGDDSPFPRPGHGLRFGP